MAVINYEECEHNGTKLICEGEEAGRKAYEKKSPKMSKNKYTPKKKNIKISQKSHAKKKDKRKIKKSTKYTKRLKKS